MTKDVIEFLKDYIKENFGGMTSGSFQGFAPENAIKTTALNTQEDNEEENDSQV